MRRATLSTCELELATPVAAADRVHKIRRSLFLELHDEDEVGVGECATSSFPGVDATTDEVVAALDERLAMGALDVVRFDTSALLGRPGPAPGTSALRAADALLEAAALDLALRREARSLASALGAPGATVAFAGVIGITDPDRAVARAVALVEAGVQRVRIKHAPGAGVASIEAVIGAVDVPVVVDANGAMDLHRDADELAALASLPLAWIEQPFAPDDLPSHAELASRGVRVGLDEAVRSRDVVVEAARVGAAQVCCVKPSRVGGIAAATAIQERASSLGIATYVGGAFEAGLGRAVLGALAAAPTPGVLAGDVVAPSAYLVEDPCHLSAPLGGRQPLHTGPGCGPHPVASSLAAVRRYGG